MRIRGNFPEKERRERGRKSEREREVSAFLSELAEIYKSRTGRRKLINL